MGASAHADLGSAATAEILNPAGQSLLHILERVFDPGLHLSQFYFVVVLAGDVFAMQRQGGLHKCYFFVGFFRSFAGRFGRTQRVLCVSVGLHQVDDEDHDLHADRDQRGGVEAPCERHPGARFWLSQEPDTPAAR